MTKVKIHYQIVPVGTPYLVSELIGSMKGYPSIGVIDVYRVNRNDPVLYLYYGQTKEDKSNPKRYPLSLWAKNGSSMAILKESDDFYSFIPEELHKINAFYLADISGIESLKNVILTYFGFMEASRKVFLSYCRAEASAIANQLFDGLCRHKYHPFLDSYIIPYGVNFQEYLHHELADCEVMVLLNTPGFASRKWCMEEVDYAKKNNLGVVQVVFKNSKPINTLPTCDVVRYNVKVGQKGKLDNLKIKEILELVERMRAKSYQYRQQAMCNRIGFECDGDELMQKDYGIVINKTKSQIYYPCVSIPSSPIIQKAESRMQQIVGTEGFNHRVLFDADGCRPDIKKHINWLNRQLSVKTLDINENIKS